MNYTEVFGAIVEIMREDSSTCKDYGTGEYEKYAEKITDDMDRMEFLHLVSDYLSTFKVYGHLRLADITLGSIGFSVMRYGDVLYVTSANEDTGLTIGDKITAIESKTIPEIAEAEKNLLMGENIERQGNMWGDILKFYKNVTVTGADGSTREVAIIHNSQGEPEEKYQGKMLSDDTLLLSFKDFADEGAICAIYDKFKQELETCKNLIVDVRGNGGGADAAFFPLLKYAYPEGVSIEEYEKIVAPIEVNFSERNCKERLELLDKLFADGVPEEAKPMVDKMLSDLNENRGKGFVLCPEEGYKGIIGKKTPERVFVIADEGCASSGEAFVEAMAFSSKVEVVGRPTCGIIDYSNCNYMRLVDFIFIYPTSRDTRLDQGKGVGQKGVPVDHYIPWSPEYLEKDPELDYILGKIG
jgi:hypothetical protein